MKLLKKLRLDSFEIIMMLIGLMVFTLQVIEYYISIILTYGGY